MVFKWLSLWAHPVGRPGLRSRYSRRPRQVARDRREAQGTADELPARNPVHRCRRAPIAAGRLGAALHRLQAGLGLRQMQSISFPQGKCQSYIFGHVLKREPRREVPSSHETGFANHQPLGQTRVGAPASPIQRGCFGPCCTTR